MIEFGTHYSEVTVTRSKVLPVVVATACLTLVAPATPALAAGGGAPGSGVAAGDFDGDGRDDLAVGVPGDQVGSETAAGSVHILYGTRQGLSAVGDEIWHQDGPGVRGVADTNDYFGAVVAAGDFDGDGFDDLAIGTPNDEDPVTGEIAGTVNILYGSGQGLSARGDDFWHQDSPNVRGRTDDGDLFGGSLATGNFGRGPADDLVIGAWSDIVTVGGTDIAGAGSVHLLFGSPAGITADGNQFWHQNSPGVNNAVETNEYFGRTLAVGDFGRSRGNDLAIGLPLEGFGSDSRVGAVQILYGRRGGAGLTSTGDQIFKQGANGVPGTAEAEEWTGWGLAAGQLGRGPRADLAIGAPFENSGSSNFAGIVIVLYGRDSGLSSQGSQRWSRGRLGFPVGDDTFGGELVIGNFTGTRARDLAVSSEFAPASGVPDAGVVHIIRGTVNGLRETRDRAWHQNSPGMVNAVEQYDSFGVSMAVGNFGRSRRVDLTIGVPNEDLVSGEMNHGAAHVLYGRDGGLSGQGSQFWHRGRPGVLGNLGQSDRFTSHFKTLD